MPVHTRQGLVPSLILLSSGVDHTRLTQLSLVFRIIPNFTIVNIIQTLLAMTAGLAMDSFRLAVTEIATEGT